MSIRGYLIALFFCNYRVASQGRNVLTLLHINDHHSHFFESSFDLRNEQVPGGLSVETSELRAYFGGAPRVSATIKALKDEAMAAGEDVLVVHAGDAITGTLYYTLFRSDPDAAVMNTIGFDAFVLGNHEFDDGDESLANFVRQLNFPVISHNLNLGETSPLRELEEDKTVKPYILKTMDSGIKVGICGITPKTSTELSSRPDDGTTFDEEIASAEACVASVKAEGAERIVLLSHLGYSFDKEKMSAINDIDVVVGGHGHELLGAESMKNFGLAPVAPYAEMFGGTCLVEAWEYSKVVGKVSIEFDSNGDVLNCTGGPMLPLNPTRFTVRDADERYDLDETDAAIVAQSLLANDVFVDYGEDQAMTDVIIPLEELANELSGGTIATVPENICHSRGSRINPLCPGKEDISQVGGGVCPIVVMSMHDSIEEAEFALQNGGSCRDDILDGNFTYGDAISILPFSNTLISMKVTGDQIRRIVEDGFNFFLDEEIGGGSGSYPYVAGLRWHVNYTKEFGNRVSELEMNPEMIPGQWVPLDLDRTYTLITNSFLVGPNDGYFTFNEVSKNDSSVYRDTYLDDAQTFINYAIKKKIIEVNPEFYSTQVLTFENGTTVDIRYRDNDNDNEMSEAFHGANVVTLLFVAMVPVVSFFIYV